MVGRAVVACLAAALVLAGCAAEPEDEDTSTVTGTGTSSSGPSASGSNSASGTGGPTGDGSGTGTNDTNAAPEIASFTGNATGLNATVSFNATDSDGDALAYTISFGDGSANVTGTNSTGNATHTYTAAGTYNVTLTVTDGTLSANRTIVLNVTAPASTAGPIDKRSCSGVLGNSPAGVSATLAGNSIGGCGFGTIAQEMVVVDLTGTSGCKHDASPTGSSSAYGTAVNKGDKFPKGAAFRLICNAGVASFSGTLSFMPTGA